MEKKLIFIIVGWLCPHTAKTHLYANEDILHPTSPLKLKYYNLNQVMKDFESLTVISVEHYCKVNPAWFTCLKMINS